MTRMVIRYDTEVGAFYLRLTDADVLRTVHVSDDVLVDLDVNGAIHGIELLCHPNSLTLEERHTLSEVYPKADEVLAEVNRLMPVQ